MSNLIPRKKAIPVQARRVDAAPETIQIPGASPIPIPPAMPGVTQNVFYVNVPASQAPPPPPQPPSPPAEVHIHTTNVYQAPRRRAGRGTSFLGTLGLVLGSVAGGVTYVPQVMSYSKPIALAGAGSAGLGLFGAILFRRVGRGVPLLGLIICGVAYCLMLKNSGQLPNTIALPKIEIPGNTAPAAPNPSPPPTLKPPMNPPAQDPNRLHDHSIFGDGDGSTWNKPSATPANPLANTPTPVLPAASTPPVVAPSTTDFATALANLELARLQAARKLGIDYTAVKTTAADARQAYEEAKIAFSPASPELVAASEKHLQADSQLNLIQTKLRSDPAVAAAEAAMKSTKSASP